MAVPTTLTLQGVSAMIFINNKYTKWYFQIISSAKLSEYKEYTETHHIVPRCLGGADDQSNLIVLTAKQHFVCHLLLTKMVRSSSQKKKLVFAAMAMCKQVSSVQDRYKVTSTVYEQLRKQVSKTQYSVSKTPVSCIFCKKELEILGFRRWHGEKCSVLTGIPNTNKGALRTDETKKKLALRAKNRKQQKCEHCGVKSTPINYHNYHGDNCKVVNKGLTVKQHSNETKEKISKSLKGLTKGYTRSEETKLKMKEVAKNRTKKSCPHCNRSMDPLNYGKYHGEKCKHIKETQ